MGWLENLENCAKCLNDPTAESPIPAFTGPHPQDYVYPSGSCAVLTAVTALAKWELDSMAEKPWGPETLGFSVTWETDNSHPT